MCNRSIPDPGKAVFGESRQEWSQQIKDQISDVLTPDPRAHLERQIYAGKETIETYKKILTAMSHKPQEVTDGN